MPRRGGVLLIVGASLLASCGNDAADRADDEVEAAEGVARQRHGAGVLADGDRLWVAGGVQGEPGDWSAVNDVTAVGIDGSTLSRASLPVPEDRFLYASLWRDADSLFVAGVSCGLISQAEYFGCRDAEPFLARVRDGADPEVLDVAEPEEALAGLSSVTILGVHNEELVLSFNGETTIDRMTPVEAQTVVRLSIREGRAELVPAPAVAPWASTCLSGSLLYAIGLEFEQDSVNITSLPLLRLDLDRPDEGWDEYGMVALPNAVQGGSFELACSSTDTIVLAATGADLLLTVIPAVHGGVPATAPAISTQTKQTFVDSRPEGVLITAVTPGYEELVVSRYAAGRWEDLYQGSGDATYTPAVVQLDGQLFDAGPARSAEQDRAAPIPLAAETEPEGQGQP
jgi:hypothetical protein